MNRSLNLHSVRDENGYNQGWSGSGSMRLRTERRGQLIAGSLHGGLGRRVLEVGCGRGEMACQLARETQMEVLGADISESFIEQAKAAASEPNVSFRAVDFLRPGDLSDQRFDYIVGNGILHHLYRDIGTSLARMHDMLAAGGRLAFLEPNLHNPYIYAIFSQPRLRRLARLEPDEMAFTRSFIRPRLEHAGFADVLVEYRDFLVPGTPACLVRAVVRLGGVAERTPVVKHLAQSLFICATKPTQAVPACPS